MGKRRENQTRDPWSPAVGGLKNAVGEIDSTYQFPQQLVAGFTPNQQFAHGQIEGLARGGNPLLEGALGAGGDLLNNATNPFAQVQQQINPRLDEASRLAAERIGRSVGDAFGGGGRSGGKLHQRSLTDAIGDSTNNFYHNAWNAQTQAQLGAAQGQANSQLGAIDRLGGLNQQRYADANMLNALGGFQQQQQQRKQLAGRQNLQQKVNLLGYIGGLGGQQSSVVSDPNANIGAASGLIGSLGGLAGGVSGTGGIASLF